MGGAQWLPPFLRRTLAMKELKFYREQSTSAEREEYCPECGEKFYFSPSIREVKKIEECENNWFGYCPYCGAYIEMYYFTVPVFVVSLLGRRSRG